MEEEEDGMGQISLKKEGEGRRGWGRMLEGEERRKGWRREI